MTTFLHGLNRSTAKSGSTPGSTHGSTLWWAACALLGACATQSSALPADSVQGAASAIVKAEQAQAMEVPQAKMHLQLAKELNERARKFALNGENEAATGLLMRAQADAELAAALARQERPTASAERQTETLSGAPTAAPPSTVPPAGMETAPSAPAIPSESAAPSAGEPARAPAQVGESPISPQHRTGSPAQPQRSPSKEVTP